MNGKELERVQKMGDAEWRGYLAAKVEDLAVIKKEVKEIKACVGKVQIEVAKMTPHCIQVNKIESLDKKVDVLNEDKAGRKAVAKALWGSGGFIGLVGLTYLLLKVFGGI
jgi:hypothetical protein